MRKVIVGELCLKIKLFNHNLALKLFLLLIKLVSLKDWVIIILFLMVESLVLKIQTQLTKKVIKSWLRGQFQGCLVSMIHKIKNLFLPFLKNMISKTQTRNWEKEILYHQLVFLKIAQSGHLVNIQYNKQADKKVWGKMIKKNLKKIVSKCVFLSKYE